MEWTINKSLSPGNAIITLQLDGFGLVKVGNIQIKDNVLGLAYLGCLNGYQPADGWPQLYAAQCLIDRYGGAILEVEYDGGARVTF